MHNLAGWRLYRVEADHRPPGAGRPHARRSASGRPAAELLVDGEVVGTGEVTRTVWSRFSLTGAGLTAGWSPDFSPADEDYRGRFEFTGTLHRVDIDVDGLPVVDAEAEAEAIIARSEPSKPGSAAGGEDRSSARVERAAGLRAVRGRGGARPPPPR